MKINHHIRNIDKRRNRVRAKLHGIAARPRLSVFRSNKAMTMQAIDDDRGVTLVAATEKDIKSKAPKMQRGVEVAKVLAERAQKAKIKALVFDRGSYKYHGRVKAVADALREAGMTV
ncbi:MAG TPA: 50S ribosomal protein L18 [Candidatus Saccharimonadia bacterium]|nr:50S ribosomal protein L18 [Candidatus Saccharimonadia bacterium]